MAGRVGSHDTQINIEFDQLLRFYNKDPVEAITTVDSTGSLTLSDAGLVLGDTSGGAVTTTLPSGSEYKGVNYRFKVIDNSNNWVIQRDGTDTIEGSNNVTLTILYEYLHLRYDGVDTWYQLNT